MSLPSVLIKKSTGEIVKHANYPRMDMAEVKGLDPNYEWLVKLEPFVQPDYDSRLFILNRIEEVTTEAHPNYSHLNVYKITYELEKRTNDEIEKHIENQEIIANQQVFEPNKQLETTIKVLNALIRSIKNLKLTDDETEAFAMINDISVKFAKNKDVKKLKKQQLIDGEEPELDEGWEKSK